MNIFAMVTIFSSLFFASCKATAPMSGVKEEASNMDADRNAISGLSDNEDLMIKMTSGKKGSLADGVGGVEVYINAQVFLVGREPDRHGKLKIKWGTEEFINVGSSAAVPLETSAKTSTFESVLLKGSFINTRIKNNEGKNHSFEIFVRIYEDDLLKDNLVASSIVEMEDILEIAKSKEKTKEIILVDRDTKAEFTVELQILPVVNKDL